MTSIQVVTGVQTNQSNIPWMVAVVDWLSTAQPWAVFVTYAQAASVFSGN